MKDVLKEMSCHYTKLDPQYMAKWQVENPGVPCPPEKLSDELLQNLVKSRAVNRALWFLDQL